ncbi:MAG: hypothetical protein V2J89_10565 [Halieaceae bacterium]|jgi:hypothetical protein|nr:hypothetical protein [Halieaceae bacterium]
MLFTRTALLVFAALPLCGCTAMAVTGAVVGTAAAVAVEVVELPFEVAAGVHGAVSDDDDDAEKDGRDDGEGG